MNWESYYEPTIITEWYGMTHVGLHLIVKLIDYNYDYRLWFAPACRWDKCRNCVNMCKSSLFISTCCIIVRHKCCWAKRLWVWRWNCCLCFRRQRRVWSMCFSAVGSVYVVCFCYTVSRWYTYFDLPTYINIMCVCMISYETIPTAYLPYMDVLTYIYIYKYTF